LCYKLLHVKEELSAQRPLVAIDDLQWADPSTLLVLHRLGRSVTAFPCCWWVPAGRYPPPDLERLLARRVLGVALTWLP
jgi:hypothetical protein